MIKKLTLSIVAISALSVSIFAKDLSIDEKVKAILPKTDVGQILPTPIPDIYYVSDNGGNTMHVDVERKLIIFGEIYTANGQPLTAPITKKWQEKLLQEKIGKISPSDVQELVKGSISSDKTGGKYELIQFTDPDCPFCKRAEEFLSTQNITRHIIFTPLPMHPKAKPHAIQFASSENPFLSYKNFDLSHVETEKGKHMVDNMAELGKKFGISGTPYFFVIDSTKNTVVDVIAGANIGSLENWIRKNQNNGEKK